MRVYSLNFLKAISLIIQESFRQFLTVKRTIVQAAVFGFSVGISLGCLVRAWAVTKSTIIFFWKIGTKCRSHNSLGINYNNEVTKQE